MYLDDMKALKQLANEMAQQEKIEKLEEEFATMWMPWE
jgi:hypothetical protein